jgi:outer membrane protein assembly factor BamB
MTRTTWGVLGVGALALLVVWNVQGNAALWRERSHLIYVTSERGTLTALELQTGTPPWSFAARKAIAASSVVAGDVLYVASDDRTLSALDARDGSLRWQFTAGDSIHATPVIGNGRVYVSAMDGVVYALQ